jgi:GNAT superfamily N-acetyltransferase
MHTPYTILREVRNMYTVRHAHPQDRGEIAAIARANSRAIGFVPRLWIDESIRKREVIVAVATPSSSANVVGDEDVVGFARFHITRKGRCTLYEIAVREDARGRGYGRALIEELCLIARQCGATHVLAKCPIDLPANTFYEHLGFANVETEPAQGRRRALRIWVRSLE